MLRFICDQATAARKVLISLLSGSGRRYGHAHSEVDDGPSARVLEGLLLPKVRVGEGMRLPAVRGSHEHN